MGWWENQHGKQLRISGTATFASCLLVSLSGMQLLFLQDSTKYGDYTSYAIIMIVIGVIGLGIAAPTFLNLKARANSLEAIMNLTSTSELRKRRSDGDAAASLLGGVHAEAWESFLKEKGLKKR